MQNQGFATMLNTGFSITFANGCTASVQFGATNYCEASDSSPTAYRQEMLKERHECKNAEVAAWDSRDKWITRKLFRGLEDDVKGHMTPAEVLAFLNAVAAFKA